MSHHAPRIARGPKIRPGDISIRPRPNAVETAAGREDRVDRPVHVERYDTIAARGAVVSDHGVLSCPLRSAHARAETSAASEAESATPAPSRDDRSRPTTVEALAACEPSAVRPSAARGIRLRPPQGRDF